MPVRKRIWETRTGETRRFILGASQLLRSYAVLERKVAARPRDADLYFAPQRKHS